MKFFHPVFSLATLALFLYVCSLGIKNVIRYNGFKLQYAELVNDLKKESQRNRIFKAHLLAMESKAYWEMKAREELGYVRPGEIVYEMIPSPKK